MTKADLHRAILSRVLPALLSWRSLAMEADASDDKLRLRDFVQRDLTATLLECDSSNLSLALDDLQRRILACGNTLTIEGQVNILLERLEYWRIRWETA